MKVFLVQGEHFNVPGRPTTVHSTLAGARAEAVSLVNIMLKDNGDAWDADESDWEKRLEGLQEEHGAQYCYVEISEHGVQV